DMQAEEHAVHDALVEGIVVGDDDLMERYLGDEHIETSELARALAAGVASGTVFPVLCGSATKLVGIDRLAKFLVEEAPAPALDGGQPGASAGAGASSRSEEHTSELQSREKLVCRLLLEKKSDPGRQGRRRPAARASGRRR